MLNGCQANRRYISKEIIRLSLLIAAISRAGIVVVLFLSAKRGTLPLFYDSLFYSRRFATIRHKHRDPFARKMLLPVPSYSRGD